MKIIIVDDEVLVRAGIRSLLAWDDFGCEIVGEASNGKEALDIVEKASPDMILLDITMPVMDGLEVIKQIRKTNFNIIIVVISCHEDFKLVREALLNGANDYILKQSLHQDELVRIINENRNRVRKQKNITDSIERLNFHVVMERFINGKTGCDIETAIGEGFESLLLITFMIDNYDRIQERYINRRKNFFRDTVVDITDKILFYLPRRKISFYGENRFYVFIGLNPVGRKPAYSYLPSDISSRLVHSARKYLNIDLLVGVSEINTQSDRFSLCLKQAEAAIQMSFFAENDRVFVWEECDMAKLRQEASVLVESMTDELKAAIKGNDRCGFEKILEEYKPCFYKIRRIGGNYYKKLLQLMIGELFDLTLSELHALADNIEGAQSVSAVSRLFLEWYDCNSNNAFPRYDSGNYLVRKTVQFIAENYAKDLSLKLIADYLHVSEGYISRLFKAETKTNIFKYINKIRIEHAKRLLKDHTLKPYQVADMTGFNNRIYFDNVFKSIEGVTPSEYRNKYI